MSRGLIAAADVHHSMEPSDLLPATVASTVDPITAATNRLNQLAADALELVESADQIESDDEEPGTALMPIAGNDPVAVKGRLVDLRSRAMRKQGEVEAAHKELKALMQAQIDAAMRALEPMQAMVEKLSSGIVTMNLYLGRDEEIVLLRDGERAPADTPISVRQMVLAMDEECAFAAEEGGIDAQSIDQFDAWLLADPAHIEQVIPEAKAVVAIMPRKTTRDYGDAWTNQAMEDANKQTYFLIRNGDVIYRTTAAFHVGSRLIPERTEFTSMFVESRFNHQTGQHETIELQPGTSSWARAEKAADKRHAHYFRVALVLQGLIDRTTVLAPLPAASVSLLHPHSYEMGHVLVVTDAELALGTGRKPFYEWLRDLNGQLRPGMRIIGSFTGEAWRNVNERYDGDRLSYWRHSRLRPDKASTPEALAIHTIDRRERDGFVFTFERTDEHYDWNEDGDWALIPWKNRASCTIRPNDRFILPLDLVTIEEMETYLGARTERHAYAAMFPVLKEAIAVLRKEAADEAPFRTLLAGEIAKAHGVDIDEAESAVDELVQIWKFANRHHRPLIATEDDGAGALKAIVADFARRRKTASADASITERLRSAHPTALFIGTRPSGGYSVLTPDNDRNVFVTEHVYTAGGKLRETKPWRLVDGRFAKMATLYSSDRWNVWERNASLAEQLTDPEIETAVADIVARPYEDGARIGAIVLDLKSNEIAIWSLVPRGAPSGWGTSSSAHTEIERLTWKRRPDRSASFSRDHHHRRSSYNSIHWPWADRSRDDRVVVFRDEAVVAEGLLLEHEEKAKAAANRVIFDLMFSWLKGLDRAAIAVAEAKAFERFMEDFADPDLWEGHRKTLNITGLPSRVDDAIRKLGFELAEAGVDLDGLTPRAALAALEGIDRADDKDAVTIAEAFLDLVPLAP